MTRVDLLGGGLAPATMRTRGPRHAHLEGFDLHANVWVGPSDRARLEQLCRYVLRPPLAEDRLRRLTDRRVRVALKRAWHDGTTHLLFEPLEFLEKLAALTPRPEINLVLYHGVLAPHARWRPEVVAYRRAERTEAAEPSEMGISIWMRDSGAERPRHWTWAALMRRAFDLDVLRCPRCAGRMHLIATIDEPGGHSADPRSSRAAGRTGRPAAPVFGIDGAGQAAGAPLRKPVAKQVGPWTHAGVEVCPASAWQPEVDSSRSVRRAADLTFPTRSGRIGATWRLLSALCQGNLRGAMSENGSYVVYALGAKGLRGHEPSTS